MYSSSFAAVEFLIPNWESHLTDSEKMHTSSKSGKNISNRSTIFSVSIYPSNIIIWYGLDMAKVESFGKIDKWLITAQSKKERDTNIAVWLCHAYICFIKWHTHTRATPHTHTHTDNKNSITLRCRIQLHKSHPSSRRARGENTQKKIVSFNTLAIVGNSKWKWRFESNKAFVHIAHTDSIYHI